MSTDIASVVKAMQNKATKYLQTSKNKFQFMQHG
jgi:hypothetical protein